MHTMDILIVLGTAFVCWLGWKSGMDSERR